MSLTKVSFSMIDGIALNVRDFGAKGDGVTNDLAAIQAAAAAMASNSTLFFPKGTYKLAWNGTKPTKSTIAIDLFQLTNIKIVGEGATIFIDQHNVETYGGLLFCRPRACKNVEIYGFDVRMSFVGSNKDAAYYPESGFLYAHNTEENGTTTPVPYVDRIENISVHDCYFDMRSSYGAYTTSLNPYNGDYNNGGKYYSCFIRGELADNVYASQNKGVNIYNLTFADTHECYGIWVWGMSDVLIHHNNFQGWATRTCNYLGQMLGGSVPAIRCHKFSTRNWRITDNVIMGRVPPLRTGTQNGAAALISMQQETTAYNREDVIVIANNTLTIGSNLETDPIPTADRGIELICAGNFDVHGNSFASHNHLAPPACGAAVYVGNPAVAGGLSINATIRGNTFHPSCERIYGVIYVSESNTSYADRSIKSLTITENVVRGYAKNFLEKASSGKTYQGALYQCISNNSFFTTDNTFYSPSNTDVTALKIYHEYSGDGVTCTNNSIIGGYRGINVSGAGAANGYYRNNFGNANNLQLITGRPNTYPDSRPTVQSFASASNVVLGGNAEVLYGYIGLALDSNGQVKDKMAGTQPGGTTLVSAPTGYTWVLFQWIVGDIS